MIDFYYWPTPNGHKITLFLEEAKIPYNLKPLNLQKEEQKRPEYLKISPNGKMPAIVDHEPKGGGAPLAIFESGAILMYLAEKTGRFMSQDLRTRFETLEWLFWQVGGLGPMAGQNHHFNAHASEKIPYAIERYVNETKRLYGVLDKQLEGREYITGEYSIADMAAYPWIVPYEMQSQKLENFPNIKSWFERIQARPATKAAYAQAEKAKSST